MSVHFTLHPIELKPQVSLADFAAVLRMSNLRPLLQGCVSGWVVAPTHLSVEDLVTKSVWDSALMLQNDHQLPPQILDVISSSWCMNASFPSEMVAVLSENNHKLLFPDQSRVPNLASEWAQSTRPPASGIIVLETDTSIGELSITPKRAEWMRTHGDRPEGDEAVTMLNLMAYVPEIGKMKMAGYAAAFQPAFEAKYGTAVKLFGSVSSYSSRESDVGSNGYTWEECAMVHYPSIWHFGEMISSAGYATLERNHKVGAMRDTCILCISETGLSRA